MLPESVYPADTLSQARAFFYTSPAAVAAVLTLVSDPAWKVMPNFHFGHMEGGYCWTTTKAPVERYISLWQERIAQTRAEKREDWTTTGPGLFRSTRTGRRAARQHRRVQSLTPSARDSGN